MGYNALGAISLQSILREENMRRKIWLSTLIGLVLGAIVGAETGTGNVVVGVVWGILAGIGVGLILDRRVWGRPPVG
jgi:drug/metabolite transporter (DMT)-like permease